MTASPELAALLDLQALDTAVDQRRHTLAHLPEAAEVAALDARAAATLGARREVALRRDEVASRQAAMEAELAATEARAGTVDARLYSGEVSAARDLQAMTDDVAALRRRASELEDRILEVLDEREPLDAEVADRDAELEALATQRADAEARRTAAASAVEAELADLAGRREAAASGINAALLADYERIRARTGGVGAARLVGDRCDGCHLTLPAAELDRVRRAPVGTVQHCEECGRILVP